MTTSSPPNLALEQPSCSRPPAIRVVVGYPWTKAGNDRALAPRSDKRWASIRDHVVSVGNWVSTSVARRLRAPVPFVFEVARMRGTHSRMLLENLRARFAECDILIMDIGSSDAKSFNPNVLIETGMAIALQDGVLQDLFILKPAGLRAPSDLSGFLFTDYEVIDGDSAIKLVDVQGFQAALRSAVLRKARERNMIGPREGPYSGPEDEDEGDFPTVLTSGSPKGPSGTAINTAKRRQPATHAKK